jgi:hypothetical protein
MRHKKGKNKMSKESQTKNMRRLAELLCTDLGYIFGKKESGPNGAKAEFLRKGRAFVSGLAKDLGLTDVRITVNKAGIACSGEICLYGMWKKGHGLFLCLEQNLATRFCILYRSISDPGDLTGGDNRYISTAFLATGNYGLLLERLSEVKPKEAESVRTAA